MKAPEDGVYSVTQITRMIKDTLEGSFPSVRIEGEISNCRPSSTGHLYFTLKDREAAISAVMFRGRLGSLRFAPADGQMVVAGGNISVYAVRGTYQLICETIELAGEGRILAMLEERRRQLAAEGLFDESLKKPIPLLPSRIVVVTSPTGAALRDILTVTRRRNPGIDILILPAPVQGEGAAEIIARQIRLANAHRLGDVIIVGRGGGSIEDLLPFSDEEVVRAVAESEIPVISAVGHEVDWSLCDYAASRRAPTPSAAAEIVTPDRGDLRRRIGEAARSLGRAMDRRLTEIRGLLRFYTPESMERSFNVLMQPFLLRLDDAKEGLLTGMRELVRESRHRLELASRSLEAHSPMAILSKGYAVVKHRRTGKPMTGIGGVSPGDPIEVIFSKGSIDARIEEIHP